jgi:hypothetical protein
VSGPGGYLATLLGALAAGAGAVVGGLLAVDPYGVWRDQGPRVPAFVMYQPRLFKPHDVARHRPETLLLGTSRVEQALDPLNPLLEGRAYNLAVPGARPYELLRQLEHACAVAPVKRVLLEVAFFSFVNDGNEHEAGFSEARLAVSPAGEARPPWRLADLADTAWSLESCAAAWQIRRGDFGPGTPLELIYLSGRNNPAFVLSVNPDGTPRSRRETFDANGQRFLAVAYPAWKGADAAGRWPQIARLDAIARLCRARGIDLRAFITPEHARQTWALRACGRWDDYRRFKQAATATLALHALPLWDFSRVCAETAEEIPPAGPGTMRWWRDGGHYTVALGDLVLRRLLAGDGPAGFGVALDPAGLDAELAAQEHLLAGWGAAHPEEVAWVERHARRPGEQPVASAAPAP